VMLPRMPRGEGVLLEVSFESPEDMERNLQAKVSRALQQKLGTHGLQKDELGESVMTIKGRSGRVYHSRSLFEKAFPGGPGPDAFPMHVSVEYATSRDAAVVQVTLDGPLVQDWETEVASLLLAARRAKAAELRCALGDEPVNITLVDSSGQRFASKEDLEGAYEEQDSLPEDAFPLSLLVVYDRKAQDNSASSCQTVTTGGFNQKRVYAPRFAGNWAQKDPEEVRINGNMLYWSNSGGKRDDSPASIDPVDDGNGDSTSFVMCTPSGRWARATLHKSMSSYDISQDELHWDDGEVWTRVVRRHPSASWILFQETNQHQKRFSSVSKVALGLALTCLFMAAWAGVIAIEAMEEHEYHRSPSLAPSPAPSPAPARPRTHDPAPDLPAEVQELKKRLAAAEHQRALAEGAAEREKQLAQAARREADEKAREADERAREADEKATAAKKAAKEAEARYVQSNTGRLTRFLAWLGSLPFQGSIALAAGTAGLLAVVGPSSFARPFLALSGSAAAGLLAGAAAALLVDRVAGGESLGSFTDAVMALVQGGEARGSDAVGCLAWLGLTVLGVARWATRFECALYALLDEVRMDSDGTLLIDDRDNLRLPLVDSTQREVTNGRSGRR